MSEDKPKTTEEQKINVEFDHATQYDTMLKEIYCATRRYVDIVDGNENYPEFNIEAKQITVGAAQHACSELLTKIPLMVLNEVSAIQDDIKKDGSIEKIDLAIEVVEQLNKLTEVLVTQLTYLERQQWAVDHHIEETYDDVCKECREKEEAEKEETIEDNKSGFGKNFKHRKW